MQLGFRGLRKAFSRKGSENGSDEEEMKVDDKNGRGEERERRETRYKEGKVSEPPGRRTRRGSRDTLLPCVRQGISRVEAVYSVHKAPRTGSFST